MNVYIKKTAAITFILLASTLMLAVLASAQLPDDAIVIILPSAGGTTNPAPGNYTYANGTNVMLTAIPDEGFTFSYWIVSGENTPGHTPGVPGYFTDPDTGEIVQLPPRPSTTAALDSLVFTANPANITCGYGYTYNYQAVFAPTGAPPTTTPPPQTSPPTNESQIVNILASIGGTTTPAPGTYTYTNNQQFTLTATPSAGFAFHYWIVTGSYQPGHLAQPEYIPGVTEQFPSVPSNIFRPNTQDSLVFSINPVTITCGYGYTYNYQAVFTPATASVPPIATSTPPPTATPPAGTATPTAQVTATPTPTPTPGPIAGTDYTLAIVAAIVVIIIIIIVVAAVMMRKKK